MWEKSRCLGKMETDFWSGSKIPVLRSFVCHGQERNSPPSNMSVAMRWACLCLILNCSLFWRAVLSKKDHPVLAQTNLLFIMFDDLRPELSIYGKKHMITPNFERLAKRSVVFDIALCQVAVCNPSRDSILTGLRPDTMGHYNFQQSYLPNKLFPEHLVAAGYKTAGYGKVRHWDGKDKNLWTEDQFDGPMEPMPKKAATDPRAPVKPYMSWYDYQNYEWNFMRSSVMPDKEKKIETFPDHIIATRAREQITKFAEGGSYWMQAVGFKMPHTALHVPYSYWQQYDKVRPVWQAAAKEIRSYPKKAPPVGYRCCAEEQWRFMDQEGASGSRRSEQLGNMNRTLSEEMYVESMQGYAAAVSFADAQLGRILDKLDELDLWKNVTVVLTADHGMHNGEKAIWEKWTLFDEATRVPLLISHPKSPFQSTHVFHPVELVDIFPTVLDLVSAPHIRKIYSGHHTKGAFRKPDSAIDAFSRGVGDKITKGLHDLGLVERKEVLDREAKASAAEHAEKLREPSGRSLAPLVVGHRYNLLSSLNGPHGHKRKHGGPGGHKRNSHPFAVSQSIRCAKGVEAATDTRISQMTRAVKGFAGSGKLVTHRHHIWQDCDLNAGNFTIKNEISLMGYSARSANFRYTLWLHWDRVKRVPSWERRSDIIFAEELYDHRTEELGGFTHFEQVNLADDPLFKTILEEQREQLLEWVRATVFKHGDDVNYKHNLAEYFEERAANATQAGQAASVTFLKSMPSSGDVALRGAAASA